MPNDKQETPTVLVLQQEAGVTMSGEGRLTLRVGYEVGSIEQCRGGFVVTPSTRPNAPKLPMGATRMYLPDRVVKHALWMKVQP